MSRAIRPIAGCSPTEYIQSAFPTRSEYVCLPWRGPQKTGLLLCANGVQVLGAEKTAEGCQVLGLGGV